MEFFFAIFALQYVNVAHFRGDFTTDFTDRDLAIRAKISYP